MPVKRSKPFSVTKAVKANARERVGQPKPEKVIVSEPKDARQMRKHKPTLSEILSEKES